MKYISLLFVLFYFPLFAQNSLLQHIDVDFDLGFGLNYQFSSFGKTKYHDAKIPGEFSRRRINQPDVRRNWRLFGNTISDNPFFHGGYFLEMGAKVDWAPGFSTTASIVGEQRGFSDGRFSTRTLNMFPYFNGIFERKLGKINLSLQAGDFYNAKLYEGLTYNNLQVTGWSLKLKCKHFYVKQFGIADLLRNIGLCIDDVYDYSFGWEALEPFSNTDLDIRLGYSDNRFIPFSGIYSASARISYDSVFHLYTQFSHRNITGASNAFLIGIELNKIKNGRIEWQADLTYKMYTAAFNADFIQKDTICTVFYRDTSEFASFTNSTYEVFFPLEYYERRFDQWAVFTEYAGRNVSGLNFYHKFLFNISHDFYLKNELDFNWIFTETSTFLYPFYTFGFGFKPRSEINLFLEISNKVLNFDKHFPTFYASKKPYWSVHIYKPFKHKMENDRLHRM